MSKNNKNGNEKEKGKGRMQAQLRLSPDALAFLTEVANIAGRSSGLVCEDCLWAQLPAEREKYIARKALIANNATHAKNKK